MKDLIDLLTDKINVHGELHLDSHQTTLLLGLLSSYDKSFEAAIATIDKISKEIENERHS